MNLQMIIGVDKEQKQALSPVPLSSSLIPAFLLVFYALEMQDLVLFHPYICPPKFCYQFLCCFTGYRALARGERSTVTAIGASLCLIISFAIPSLTDSLGVWSLGAQGGRAKTKAGRAKPKGGHSATL